MIALKVFVIAIFIGCVAFLGGAIWAAWKAGRR